MFESLVQTKVMVFVRAASNNKIISRQTGILKKGNTGYYIGQENGDFLYLDNHMTVVRSYSYKDSSGKVDIIEISI